MNFDEQGNLWVATNGDSPSEGGLLLFTPPDIDFITPVNEVNEIQEFQLHSFPNPSTTATTISYHIPNNNQVQLQLYDLNGRLIETIFNQKQGQGNYQVRVPTDHLSKGIYFCKLQSDKHQIHHKIIVN